MTNQNDIWIISSSSFFHLLSASVRLVQWIDGTHTYEKKPGDSGSFRINRLIRQPKTIQVPANISSKLHDMWPMESQSNAINSKLNEQFINRNNCMRTLFIIYAKNDTAFVYKRMCNVYNFSSHVFCTCTVYFFDYLVCTNCASTMLIQHTDY